MISRQSVGCFPSRKCFSFNPNSKSAMKRKSETTRGASLPDVVYFSMCKIWSKNQAVYDEAWVGSSTLRSVSERERRIHRLAVL
jgi:hypothetical protein